MYYSGTGFDTELVLTSVDDHTRGPLHRVGLDRIANTLFVEVGMRIASPWALRNTRPLDIVRLLVARFSTLPLAASHSWKPGSLALSMSREKTVEASQAEAQES